MKHAPKAGGLAPLRVLLIAAGCAWFCTAGFAAQYARGRLIPEVHLKNGTTLHAVTVIAVGSTTVIARWDGGQGSILLALLPDDMRADLAPAPAVAAKPTPAPAPAVAAAADPKLASAELPTEIKLTNGFIMHKSTVTRWQPDSVLVSYQGGIVSVRFKNIAPEQRVIFEARKDEALDRQAKEDSHVSSGEDSAAHEEQARLAQEESDREQAEKKADEIQKGIASHYLVKGMTKEQVKEGYGKPLDDSGDTFFYPSRGHDKYGNSADRMLVFKDGVLVSWRDQRDQEPAGAVDY